jgi:hypothetical protein|tara:strand:+ start:16859 stop:17173 length:315 start_codon:yes stop_codon:yes gene_type:complete
MENKMEQRGGVKELEKHLSDAINNINSDRAVTNSLLADVIILLKKNELNHKEVGQIAAKYVETLQRSNEQLVKVCTILHKQDSSPSGLTDRDRDELFDMIKEEK